MDLGVLIYLDVCGIDPSGKLLCLNPYKKLQDSKSDHMSGTQACRPLVHQFKTATKLGDFQEPD